jgi:hypothetical protein
MLPRTMMGIESPGDQKVPITVRDWSALRLALWRSKVAWEIAAREAAAIAARCAHAEGCAGREVETEPCRNECPDREQRMSALVVLNAARQFAPVDARRLADGPYFAPSREYFSETLADLTATQLENEFLREALRAAGVQPPTTLPASLPPSTDDGKTWAPPALPQPEETP